MLSVKEKADPTLLVLVRPPEPPLTVRFCHDVGGSAGRGLGMGFREAAVAESLSLVYESSCNAPLLGERAKGCEVDLREEEDRRLVRFRVDSRRVNGDGASSSSLGFRSQLGCDVRKL